MTLTRLPPPGAPGIYYQETPPPPTLDAVRMDVAAFAGLAPRGPAWVPIVDEQWAADDPDIGEARPRIRSLAVPVDSWDEYLFRYGGHEGPGRLPLAVAAFFENGGRRAYIVRIVALEDPADDPDHPVTGPDAGVAAGAFTGIATSGGAEVGLRARSQGVWGNSLRATLEFVAEPLPHVAVAGADIDLPSGMTVPRGSTLRLSFAGGAREWRTVTAVGRRLHTDRPGHTTVATVDSALPGDPARIDVVTGRITIDDGDLAVDRTEVFDQIGLSALHANWLATVLFTSSQLVFADPAWIDADLRPADFALRSAEASEFTCGRDSYFRVTPEACFDSAWTPGDTGPASGVHAVADLRDVSLLVAPDLYSPAPLVEIDETEVVSLAGPEFEECVPLPPPPDEPEAGDGCPAPRESDRLLDGLRLDPEVGPDLDRIGDLQKDLVDFADQIANFVVLLDVPPGLDRRLALEWRAGLRSTYAAAYYPWLYSTLTAPDGGKHRVLVGPTAAAAGIVARREHVFGVPHGPANELAAGAFDVAPRLSPADHAALFAAGINVFTRERDGIRLTSARTLAGAPAYRQLNVRRIMTMLRRTLEQQAQWLVFEPNNRFLQADVRNYLRSFLRRLYQAGAFRGATPDEAFFVRCDESNNTLRDADAGRLIVDVGVAPAEPLEFLILRIARDGDNTLRVEEVHG